MTMTVLPAPALTPHPLVYVEQRVAHSQNGAVTGCYIGPVGRGLREVGALEPGTAWCWTCYPSRCPACGDPLRSLLDTCSRPACLRIDLDADKAMERAL